MFGWWKKLSVELRIWLALGTAFVLTVWGATALREVDRKTEEKINNARTQKALGQLWDSLRVNRAENRTEHAVLTAKLDSLLHYGWIIGFLAMKGAC